MAEIYGQENSGLLKPCFLTHGVVAVVVVIVIDVVVVIVAAAVAVVIVNQP